MKKALAVLAVAIAVGGCVTVVPVPVRTAPPPTPTPDSARHHKPPTVVVISDPQDSTHVRREGWRGHPTDTVVEVAGTTGKTDHRPPWAARPHEGGPTELPPGLAKHDSPPPGQVRKEGKPDRSEHGPPDKEAKPHVERVVVAHPEAPGHDKKPDQGVRDEHGNNGAEHGNNGAKSGGKGVASGNKGVDASNKSADHGNRGAEAGRKGIEPGITSAESGRRGDEAGKKGVEPGNKPVEPNPEGAKAEKRTVAPGNQSAASGKKGVEPGNKPVEPNPKGAKAEEKTAAPGNQSAGPAEKIVPPGNKGAESGSKAVEPDNRTKADQAKQGGGKPSPAAQSDKEQIARAPSTSVAVATIAQLLGSDALVGQRVQVTGTCLSAKNRSATGGAPAGKNDWQLGSGGAAIWVTGNRPEGCSPAANGRGQVTITAKVAEDQLPGHGKKSGGTRRYLVIG